MLLQHQRQQPAECELPVSPRKTVTDEEVLVWCYTNANSQFMSANNALEIIVNLCSCSAKDIDLAKVIRSQIQFVSDQLSNKSYQTVIHSPNDSNSSTSSSADESGQRIALPLDNEINDLRNTQNLLRKKYGLLSLLRSELTNCRCECADTSPVNGNILSHLSLSEFNCNMWFRQIKVIETKLECNRQSLPFDVFKVVSQLLDTNQLNINSIPIASDFDNNNNTDSNGLKNSGNNDMKIEKFSVNDCLTASESVREESGYAGLQSGSNGCHGCNGLIANEYCANTDANENSFGESHKNMQILRYDSLLSVNEATSLPLEPINNNDMTVNGCGVDVDASVSGAEAEVKADADVDVSDANGPTFQELHPISSNVGLNYSVHEISHLIRSNQIFDYRTTNCNTNSSNHFGDDMLPQITAIEIDQILNT